MEGDLLDEVKSAGNPLVVPGTDGKPRFMGVEDPNNPPVRGPKPCLHGTEECNHMRCPKCGGYFDTLLGEGKEQACEACFDIGEKKG